MHTFCHWRSRHSCRAARPTPRRTIRPARIPWGHDIWARRFCCPGSTTLSPGHLSSARPSASWTTGLSSRHLHSQFSAMRDYYYIPFTPVKEPRASWVYSSEIKLFLRFLHDDEARLFLGFYLYDGEIISSFLLCQVLLKLNLDTFYVSTSTYIPPFMYFYYISFFILNLLF